MGEEKRGSPCNNPLVSAMLDMLLGIANSAGFAQTKFPQISLDSCLEASLEEEAATYTGDGYFFALEYGEGQLTVTTSGTLAALVADDSTVWGEAMMQYVACLLKTTIDETGDQEARVIKIGPGPFADVMAEGVDSAFQEMYLGHLAATNQLREFGTGMFRAYHLLDFEELEQEVCCYLISAPTEEDDSWIQDELWGSALGLADLYMKAAKIGFCKVRPKVSGIKVFASSLTTCFEIIKGADSWEIKSRLLYDLGATIMKDINIPLLVVADNIGYVELPGDLCCETLYPRGTFNGTDVVTAMQAAITAEMHMFAADYRRNGRGNVNRVVL